MNCSICYNEISDLNKVVTKCNHVFHFSCLLKNFKNNTSTGEQCPLCRKPFLQSSFTNNSNTYRPPQRLVEIMSLLQRIRQPSPPPRPRNEIIREINIRRQNARRISNSTSIPAHRRIRKQIEKLSFHELKERLRREGLSTRGYIRENLENRLFNKLMRR